jgi:hypothetical protein
MNDLSAHPLRLDAALDLLETSEGLSVPGVDRSVHLRVLSEAFMEVASPAEAIALEASVAATPAAVTPVVEVTDNHRCQLTIEIERERQD